MNVDLVNLKEDKKLQVHLVQIHGGWEVISKDKVEPGDILCYSGHVEIYAGNGRVYNMGSNNAINSEGTSELPESSGTDKGPNNATKILRAPTK